MLDRLDETIVAISSAPGRGPLGIVRLSGARAVELAGQLGFQERSEARRAGWRRVRGEVRIDDGLTLPAWYYVFPQPHSYTREDLVEIHTVGTPVVLELVRRRALAAGALAAEPGEFTARAFFRGRLNLVEAEAVAEVIRARTDTQLRAARRLLEGALTVPVRELRGQMSELAALVEAGIDFAEEPIEFITLGQLRARLAEVRAQLAKVRRSAVALERLEVVPRILLFGPPNAGKSSLLNQLSGTSRAICAAVEGTTRDVLSAPLSLGGAEVLLLDTAGVAEQPSELLARARELTQATARSVELVCVVVSLAEQTDLPKLAARVRALEVGAAAVAANKCDLVSDEERARLVAELERLELGPVCLVSALTGDGCTQLCELFARTLFAGRAAGETISREALGLSVRQREALTVAEEALARAESLAAGAADTIDCADLLAFELREALETLGTLTGEVTTDDLLEVVFSHFCIGK